MWQQFEPDTIPDTSVYNGELAKTEFECTVKGKFKETYGKMPTEDFQKQIVMEYEYYTDLIA